MDPVIITGGLAVAFALVALLLWRRAVELGEKVRELEAKLAAPLDPASAPPAIVEASAAAEGDPSDSEESVEEEEPTDAAESAEEDEPAEEEAEAPAEEKAVEPAAAAPPSALAADPLRVQALEVVSEAFEVARYLDFEAIVEKPSTYRVTVPITAANGEAVRYLEDGMFSCLSQVRIEENTAILHIDTGKGPP